jgi:hypothetical protein
MRNARRVWWFLPWGGQQAFSDIATRSETMSHMITPVELTDLELDAVAGGGNHGGGNGHPRNIAGDNLVNVQANIENLQVGVQAAVLSERIEFLQQ